MACQPRTWSVSCSHRANQSTGERCNHVFRNEIIVKSIFYRCKVPECDVADTNGIMEYDQSWLSQAIPFTKESFHNCARFEVNKSIPIECGRCLDSYFDRRKMQKCDDYVFKSTARNMQHEVSADCFRLLN